MNGAEAYTRLPGSGRTLAAKHTLWLGSDHLLAVENNGFKEVYGRYLYADIWAIRVRRTENHARRLYGLAGALGGSLALLSIDAGMQVLLGGLALSGFSLLFYDLWLGPTCVTQLLTAVSTRVLPSLGRVKSADHAVAVLSSRIAAFQDARRSSSWR